MSHNIDTSTAPTASLLTVEEINGWNRDRVKGFLQERRADLDLEGEDIDKMYNQKVLKGSTFLELTREDLLSIKIPLGTAKEILKLISKIKRGKRTSFFPALLYLPIIPNTYYILCFSFLLLIVKPAPKNLFSLL